MQTTAIYVCREIVWREADRRIVIADCLLPPVQREIRIAPPHQRVRVVRAILQGLVAARDGFVRPAGIALNETATGVAFDGIRLDPNGFREICQCRFGLAIAVMCSATKDISLRETRF